MRRKTVRVYLYTANVHYGPASRISPKRYDVVYCNSANVWSWHLNTLTRTYAPKYQNHIAFQVFRIQNISYEKSQLDAYYLVLHIVSVFDDFLYTKITSWSNRFSEKKMYHFENNISFYVVFDEKYIYFFNLYSFHIHIDIKRCINMYIILYFVNHILYDYLKFLKDKIILIY